MFKQILTVVRENGTTEEIDMTNFKYGTINKEKFEMIKKATKEAGKGNVIKVVITETKSNAYALQKNFNRINNEGAYGYTPEESYYKSLPEYKEWEETTEIK